MDCLNYKIYLILYFLILNIMMIGCNQENNKDINNQSSSRTDRDSLRLSYDLPPEVKQLNNVSIIDSNATPKMDIEFAKMFSVGDSIGPSYIRHVEVDNQGRIYLGYGSAVRGKKKIFVYDNDGEFIQTMGGAGRGPGEFQTFKDIMLQDEKLYTLDNILKRINVFSLESLESSNTIRLDPKKWNNITNLEGATVDGIYPGKNQQVLTAFKEPSRGTLVVNNEFDPEAKRYYRYYLMNPDGKIVSNMIFKNRESLFGTSFPLPSGYNLRDYPFDRNPLTAITADGTIYSAWTEKFLIKVFNPDGNYLRAFYKPHANSALNTGNLSDYIQDLLDETEVPDDWPALDQLLVDDSNRLWVSTIAEDRENYSWWVIDRNGNVLAKFKWPGNVIDRHREDEKIRLIKDNFLYAVEPSEKTKGEKVVKYRISMRNH